MNELFNAIAGWMVDNIAIINPMTEEDWKRMEEKDPDMFKNKG